MAAAPVKPGVRRAWLTIGTIVAVATLAWGTMTVVDLVAFGRERRHDVVTEPIARVEIHNDNGTNVVIGTDAAEVVVDTSIRRGLQRPSASLTVDGDTLVVRSRCAPVLGMFCSVDLTVRVPRDVAVVVRGGSLTVDGLDGDLDSSTSGGGTRVHNSSGALRLRSSGGGIRAEQLTSAVVDAQSSGGGIFLGFVAPPTRVEVGSSGGGVTVEVPDTPDPYKLDVSSSGGSVRTDVRTDPTSSRSIVARSSGGGVTVRYPRQ